jgi:hypothetical protein
MEASLPALRIFMNAEEMALDVDDLNKVVIADNQELSVGVLQHGMESGEHSVSFVFKLPDGRTVFAETSLNLFLTAARAFAARYGWPA